MKKPFCKLGIALASLVLFSNACNSQAIDRTSPIPYEGWYTVSKISPEVYLIDEQHQATCYLVIGKEKALLIDTGIGGGDLSGQVKALTSLPVMVVNTHGHNDHLGGNYQFDEVWTPAPDVYMSDRFFDRNNWIRAVDGFVSQTRDKWKDVDNADAVIERIKNIPPPKVNTIADGDKIDLGGKVIEICALPGHTPGSMVLIDRKDGILFSGDAIITHSWMWLQDSLPLDVYAVALGMALPRFEGLKTIYHGHEQRVEGLKIDYAKSVQAHIADIMKGKVLSKPDNLYNTPVAKYEFSDWMMFLKTSEAEKYAKIAKK